MNWLGLDRNSLQNGVSASSKHSKVWFRLQTRGALSCVCDARCVRQNHKADHDGSNADTLCLQVPIAGDE